MRRGCGYVGGRRGPLAVVLAALLVAGSCGGGGDAAPDFEPIVRITTTLPTPQASTQPTTSSPETPADSAATTVPTAATVSTTGTATTTTTAAPDQPTRFDLFDDGWSFRNYRGRDAGAFGVEDAIALFGADAVCVESEGPCTPRPAAAEWIEMVATSMGYGVCEGMTVSALDRFLVGKEPLTGDLPLTEDVQRRVARLFSTQYLDDLINATKQWRKRSVADIVAELEASFADPSHEQYTLGVYTGGGGHSVLPRGIEWQPDGRAVILVYDPNWPQRDRYIEVDPVNDSWRFGYFGADQLTDPEAWTGNGKRMDLSPLSVREAPFPEPFSGSGTGTGLLLAVTAEDRNWALTIGAGGGATRVSGDTAVPGENGVVAVIRAGTYGADTALVRVPERNVALSLEGESRITAIAETGTASVAVLGQAEVAIASGATELRVAVDSVEESQVALATEAEYITIDVPKEVDVVATLEEASSNIDFRDVEGRTVQQVEVERADERLDVAVSVEDGAEASQPQAAAAEVRAAEEEGLLDGIDETPPPTTRPIGDEDPADATTTTPATTTPAPTTTTTWAATVHPDDCTIDLFEDGSESGWCDDGTSWWHDADGTWSRTEVDLVTGCWTTTSSDGWESGWCDGSGLPERSWYEDGTGYRSESLTDPSTGCTRSTDSAGMDETWCPDLGFQTAAEVDVVVATTVPGGVNELLPEGCTREFYDDGSESGWCEDGTSWWVGVDGYTSHTAVDLATGCSRTTDSTGFDQTWCPELLVDITEAEGSSADPVEEGCELTINDDGSESGWCEDGSSWWLGVDGSWTRVDVDATGCGFATSSDGSSSGWCPNGTSWWNRADGGWGQTTVDATTGCTTTTDHTGLDSTWCPDGAGGENPTTTWADPTSTTWADVSSTTSVDVTSTTWVDAATTTWLDAATTTLAPGCTVTYGEDGSESGWCPDGSSWWNGANGFWSRTEVDDAGCGASTSSDGSSSGWCPDGSSWWSAADGAWGQTTVDATTGCNRSTDSTGYDSTWCPESATATTTTTTLPATTTTTTTLPATTTTTTLPATTTTTTLPATTTTTTTTTLPATTTTTTTTTLPATTTTTTSIVPIAKTNCTLMAYDNGDESGWCDDGTSFWWGSDGYWSITAHSADSGCSVTASSDGSSSGWCDGSGWEQNRSWWTSASGYVSTTVTNVWTGCTTTTDTDGYYDYSCPSEYPTGPASNANCSLTWYDNGDESGWCDDGSSWWNAVDGTWNLTASSAQSGCSVTSGSNAATYIWCDGDGFGEWSWSHNTDGTWYFTQPIRGTGCTRSTDHTGYDSTWCPTDT